MTLMYRVGVFGLALLYPIVGWAQPTPPDGHSIEGLSHPESVAAAPDGEAFYATNFGDELAPTDEDGDGFITKLAGDGTVEARRFLPSDADDAALHAPKGTVVVNGRLYTADVDRVVGFDLETRSKTVEVSLQDKGVSFLNGLAAKDAQTLFASATSQGTIYRVDLQDGTATALATEIPQANGVAYAAEASALHVVTFGGNSGGQLRTLHLKGDRTIAETTTRTIRSGGRFDGLVRHNGALLISSWGVKGTDERPPVLYRVDDGGTGAVTTTPLSGWQGPADFDCTGGRGCWIPNLPGSSVEVVRPEERAFDQE